MNLRFSSSALTLTGVACVLLACGSVDPADQPGSGGDGGGGSPVPEGPLLPWAVGNNWTYRVTKDGIVTLKTTSIGEAEMVGGDGPNAEAMAYNVTTAKCDDANYQTASWQAPSTDAP